ncbi:MAG: radical SAM protein [Bryobacteraceae bacterium]|nr:radical SAM protein [Bryobacteraceae bacterium]
MSLPYSKAFADARMILSRTSGFIAEAGFTHSLTPARNCTFGCSYCYVPTMRVQGGLKPEDWQRWGQFTTYKQNAAVLLRRELRPGQVIYCSPLVDPYQPGEALMPEVLRELIAQPPAVFVIQTRSPGILRDLELLQALAARCTLRVSFSITSNRADVLRRYEPKCAPYAERLQTVAALHEHGIPTFVTLAPLLPCDAEALLSDVMRVSPNGLIADPLHIRATKPRGATTRDIALVIADRQNEGKWFDASFQAALVDDLRTRATRAGRAFATGPEGFSWLARKMS